uniref:Uncharacterized protein n=1 Tax=Magnetospirillum gryphiswaldense TaxID=55518 RepID=A4TYR3_9PROT|nr:hypothetical protein MGR_2347 [Magnetospirillum gryphiswaldense MSR-1]
MNEKTTARAIRIEDYLGVAIASKEGSKNCPCTGTSAGCNSPDIAPSGNFVVRPIWNWSPFHTWCKGGGAQVEGQYSAGSIGVSLLRRCGMTGDWNDHGYLLVVRAAGARAMSGQGQRFRPNPMDDPVRCCGHADRLMRRGRAIFPENCSRPESARPLICNGYFK